MADGMGLIIYLSIYNNNIFTTSSRAPLFWAPPKIWAKHECHSFQNWRVKIECHSFLGVSEAKECTLWKSLRIYEIFSHLLNFFALRAKWHIKYIFYYFQYCFLQSIIFSKLFSFFNLNVHKYSNQNLILQVRKFKKCKFKDPKV